MVEIAALLELKFEAIMDFFRELPTKVRAALCSSDCDADID
jgi:hypothetical protein